MAVWKRQGLILSLLAAALLSLPATASAGYGHRGHHRHHHHHHHHGHWHHGRHHHHHGHGYRGYSWNRWWHPRSYYSYGFSSGYYPYYSYSYYRYRPAWYYAPRSFYFNVSVPYYYRCAVPNYSVPYVSTNMLWLGEHRSTRPLVLAARSIEPRHTAVARETARGLPLTRLAGRSASGTERAVRVALAPAVDRVSLQQTAARVLSSGDAAFHGGRYDNAAGFYQIAAERSPTDATAHVRAGHALLAARRYHDAYRSFCQAIAIDGGAALERVKLDELYLDPDEKAKRLESLAKTALDNPNNHVLHALVGIYLKHDGQSDRAEKFFAEARRLSGGTELISRRMQPETERHVASATTDLVRQ